jgi:hypothetical protein
LSGYYLVTLKDNITMRVDIIRKILVILIIVIPVFAESGCKKQDKCGCDGDAIFTLDSERVNIYFNKDTKTVQPFQTLDNPYETYYFCNPEAMLPKLSQYTSGDLMQVTGKVFWNCTYVYNSRNYQSQYSMYYKIYDIMVTKVEVIPFGK